MRSTLRTIRLFVLSAFSEVRNEAAFGLGGKEPIVRGTIRAIWLLAPPFLRTPGKQNMMIQTLKGSQRLRPLQGRGLLMQSISGGVAALNHRLMSVIPPGSQSPSVTRSTRPAISFSRSWFAGLVLIPAGISAISRGVVAKPRTPGKLYALR